MTSENNNTSIELQAKKDLIVSNSIIRIIGVFEKKGSKKMDACLIENGFEKEGNHDYSFHKNYWYSEFRDLMFLQKEDTSAKVWKKKIQEKVILENRKTIPFTVDLVELFLFRNDLNFFTIEVSIEDSRLESYSDLTNIIRNFDSKVISDKGDEYKWVNWIEDHCLCGIKIASKKGDQANVDEYSGSKFKLYTIYETSEQTDTITTRDELLFDLGCVSPLGSAGGNESFSPDEKYFYELLQDKVSVFKNYEILPLFDTFTCLGTNLFDKDVTSFSRKTWTETYFRIVLYNLFLKYNLFRYNSKLNTDSSVKIRDEFENFLNTYNISHISYNFLPNLIAEKHRKSLQIDSELEKFQERINRISQEIQEKEQKRSNLLLTFVGIVTSLGSAKPIFSMVETFRSDHQLNSGLFYSLLSMALIGSSIPIIRFLFPEVIKSIQRKWKKKKN